MDNKLTINGKTYTFPCTVTGEEARAIRDAAPKGMLEARHSASWWAMDVFEFNLDYYHVRITPGWRPEEAPTTMNEPAPKFPLTPAEAFRALANGECVEMAGGVHRLTDKLECWVTEDSSWEPSSMDNCDFVNMRIVPDPSAPREIALTTGLHIQIRGERLEILDENREIVCYLKHSELREILNALEESHND